jgi:type IV secretion system protein VirB3
MGPRNSSLIADPVFVGATRPPMRWGVTYSALLFNVVFTMQAFLVTKNLLVLLLCVPIHGVFVLLCSRDPRFFDLLMLWARTRLAGYFGNHWVWRANAYSPLTMELPTRSGRRRRSDLEFRPYP